MVIYALGTAAGIADRQDGGNLALGFMGVAGRIAQQSAPHDPLPPPELTGRLLFFILANVAAMNNTEAVILNKGCPIDLTFWNKAAAAVMQQLADPQTAPPPPADPARRDP